MKREITEYETNKLDTLKFISWCKTYMRIYEDKKMLLPEVTKVIWKMIQEDVFNVNYSETAFNKLINDIGYNKFTWAMCDMCFIVDQNEKDYYYYINFEDKDCVSLIGEPIYKFMHRIEELIPYED